MRIKKRIIRCAYCRHEVHGTGMPHNGILYCSRSCRELGIHRSMKMESPWHIVLVILAMLLTMALTDKAQAHDPYGSWQRSDGKGSCCSGRKITDGVETGDCEPVASRFDGKAWWAKHNTYWIKIPDDKIIRERSPDPEKGHLCINTTGVLCYVPPATGT